MSSYDLNFDKPLRSITLVIAAVSVVLPWSTCPIVPTFTCGLVRSNFALPMVPLRGVSPVSGRTRPLASTNLSGVHTAGRWRCREGRGQKRGRRGTPVECASSRTLRSECQPASPFAPVVNARQAAAIYRCSHRCECTGKVETSPGADKHHSGLRGGSQPLPHWEGCPSRRGAV